MFLVGDIGGTNTTIALLDHTEGRFTLVARERYRTPELSSVTEPLRLFREQHPSDWGRATLACISAAGPVRDGICRMTNVPFVIRAQEVREFTGIDSFLINDFSAICYALPLLDTHDSIKTISLPHPDGSLAEPVGAVRAVVGAGTGLGTGFLTEDHGHFTAHPSEGGHSDFPAGTELEIAFRNFLAEKSPIAPGIEQYLSGQGIANAFAFFAATGRLPEDDVVDAIRQTPPAERPGAIARAAMNHDGLAEIMRLFVHIYARYASNAACFFLPRAGLYLAGGIAAKNERWFLDDHLFMRVFETNYNDRITPLLRSMPVVLIKDYDVSLYGAAHAALSLA
jgi:glucokinase